jgi:hypothetical protein
MGKTLLVRLAAAAAGGVLALAVAAPAYADTTIDLHPDHLGSTAEGFSDQDCTGPFADLSDGVSGWHFLLPAATGDNFVSLTLEFAEQTATITSTDADNPTVDGEVSGYFDEAAGDFRHAYVFAPSGWTLDDASAVVEGDAQGYFNLSHACGGKGDSSPSPSPSPTPSSSLSPTPSLSSSPSEGNGGGNGNGDDEELPTTGSNVGLLVGLGAVLVGAGGGMAAAVATLAVRRRRQLSELTDG